MNYKNILKKQTMIIVVSVICLTIATIGGSFALFFSISDDTNNQIVKSGELSINFGKSGSTMITEDLVPTSDENGLAQIGTNFAITNEGTLPGAYYIAVYNNKTGITDLSSFLDHKYIRISIDNGTPQTLSEIRHTEDTLASTNQNEIHYLLLRGTIASSEASAENGNIETHNIKIWITEDAPTDIIGKLIHLQIEVVSVVGSNNPIYADASGAERPVLDNGLIPVKYEENKWVKADPSSKWYDYNTQWWANAVTVSSATRDAYTNATEGTEVKMDDIETMWVWVPRYEYQHTNLSAQYAGGTQALPGGMTINFISKETTTPSSSNFTVHDAFWWDDNNDGVKDTNEQLSGIWVAKFEMSAASPTSNTLQKPIIKPNVVSWRNAQIGTMWTAIHNNMNGTDNTYGLTNSDAHLMKNMEWGAVAYLSQSKYGKYGNSGYSEANKEIYKNNSTSYYTGRSSGLPPASGETANGTYSYDGRTCTTEACNTETIDKTSEGYGASTTGNIYGIYDMSGGAYEHVMGLMKESTNTEPAVGYSTASNSGWSGKLVDGTEYTGTYGALKDIGSKYYDLYNYSTSYSDASTRYHKGDATYEAQDWYSDRAYFVNPDGPFFLRGSHRSGSTNAGIFNFSDSYGHANSNWGGRPILVQAN